ncbi:hypothetical protein ONZ45_g12373 [Pleurotus djamor]|nr:hypothetical protein ONZ45_g12373 [Pleurotus djamor]
MLLNASLLYGTLTAPAASRLPVIDVGNAKYRGAANQDVGVSSYLGIRYAAGPVGGLRWRAPQPPPKLNGVQDSQAGPQCFGSPLGTSPTGPPPNLTVQRRAPIPDFEAGSEDCLFLNVYIPGSELPKRKLPVLVFVHGGGYLLGNATMFDPTHIVSISKQSIIAVGIQYRLGIFGFLAGSEVKANGNLNSGLLDQEYALKWVHRHISKFGGDPDQVTIWGQSAGAGSVLLQMLARNGRTGSRLFNTAITSSPYLTPLYPYNGTIPEDIYRMVVAEVGCQNSNNTLSCLRTVDSSALQSANVQTNPSTVFGATPVVDGEFITKRPTQLLKQRKISVTDLLVLYNSNEGDMFIDPSTTLTAAQHSALSFPALGPNERATISRLYEGLGTTLQQVMRARGEAIFDCPAHYLLNALPGAYQGKYAIPPGLHGDDLGAYFPDFQPPTFDNPTFISSFAQTFISFIRKQDPNFKFDPTNITPRWPRYRVSEGGVVFNRTEDAQPDIRFRKVDSAFLERCAFWESVSHLTSQ